MFSLYFSHYRKRKKKKQHQCTKVWGFLDLPLVGYWNGICREKGCIETKFAKKEFSSLHFFFVFSPFNLFFCFDFVPNLLIASIDKYPFVSLANIGIA